MPQANNNIHHQQWDMCDRCGFMFPMSSLVKQKGLLVCTRRNTCFDDLTVERRSWVIAQVLGITDLDIEGADLRVIDRGFFEDFDIVQR